MPLSTFTTPTSITVSLDLYVADVRITASDRSDTTVEVRPTEPARAADVKLAESTRVEYDDATRTLSVITPKPRNRFVNFSKRSESIDVLIHVPTDSDVRGKADLGDYRTEGVLGSVTLKTGLGAVRIGETGNLSIHTGVGEVTVDEASGSAAVHSGSGEISVGTVDGTADISTSNGTIRVGVVTGPSTVKVSNGSLFVDRALSDITATNHNGGVRIGEVVRGKVTATSKNGRVDVGVRQGSAAWLDLNTTVGRVYNELESSDAPDDDEPVDKVQVHASTKLGDIVVRRAPRLEADA